LARDEGFSQEHATAFDAWCRRDARHAASVAKLEQVFAQFDALADQRDAVNARFNRVSPPRPVVVAAPPALPTVRWWRPLAWGGVAAALALGAFLGIRTLQSTTAGETRYATTTDGYEYARLDDGSTLELNTTSAARVRFTAAERHVDLESGEAHFEVAHNTERPFIVSAGGVDVRAVGTAFTVRFVSGAIEVTVTEGKVTVGPALSSHRSDTNEDGTGRSSGQPSNRGGALPSRGPTLLSAYERLTIPVTVSSDETGSAPTIERLAPADMRAALAWQRRISEFSDTPLSEVTARFNRHHAVQLVITDPALGARRIGGMFALDDVEAFVRLLERDGIVRAEREGDKVRLSAP
jgi:transmembrane sensor